VLMLRGAQTPGELKGRTERMYPFAALREVQSVVEELIERGLVERLERRAGQKEVRYRLVLEGETATEATEAEAVPVADDRLGALEERIAALEETVARLSLGLGNPGLESGSEGVPDRFQLHAVEDVLEETTND
jgi:uncharacterized protein